LRYYARSDWLATMSISEDRDMVGRKHPKIFYKSRLEKQEKQSVVPLSLLLSCSTTPIVFISQYIDTLELLILLNETYHMQVMYKIMFY